MSNTEIESLKAMLDKALADNDRLKEENKDYQKAYFDMEEQRDLWYRESERYGREKVVLQQRVGELEEACKLAFDMEEGNQMRDTTALLAALEQALGDSDG